MESSLASPSGNVYAEMSASGVSWAAVVGGAFVTAALWLILLPLGTGLGLSAVSPWTGVGASAATIGMAAILWLIVVQVIASAMGGYLAGRLRTRWVSIHTDEVYFRDTAHGFLAWCVGLVITVAFLASAAAAVAGGAARGTGSAMAAAAGRGAESDGGPDAYFVDALFRSDHPSPDRPDASVRGEVARIFAKSVRQADAPAADRTYLAQVIAARTGLSQSDAEARVSQVTAQAREAADTARKALAHLSLWIFVALLTGAFCASVAATIGGRQRDKVKSA
jgi:hypothetical protein